MKWIRRKALNFIVKNLFKGITEEEILQIKGTGGIIYRGQVLTKTDREKIASQATQMDDMFLWKILNDEMVYRAQEKMFKESENYDGMMFGKAVLYLVETQKKRIKYLKNIK